MRRAWGGLAALLAIGALTALPAQAAPVLHIESAEFEPADRSAPAQAVSLPDTWDQRGVDRRLRARYRFAFTLDAVPGESMALAFTRLSTRHRIRVNGHVAADEGVAPTNLGLPQPALIELAPALLRAGPNEVEIEVSHMRNGGLSAIDLGPLPALRTPHQRVLLLGAELPRAMNMACVGLALLLIAIWWRRRVETALGSFGLLTLIGSLRNYGYSMGVSVTGNAFWADWMLVAVNTWVASLFGVFAVTLVGEHWPRYRRWLLGVAIVVPLLAAVAAGADRLQELRGFVYPVLLTTVAPGVWLCVARPRDGRGLAALGVGAMVLGALHDYAYQAAGWLPVTDTFWMPYLMPLTLGTVALLLVRRMVRALGEVETLNSELEARVAARTQQLVRANAAKTHFLAAASHDLRQPLVTIGLLVGLAREQADVAQVRALMGRVDQAVGAMERLLSGLLDLSRFEAGAVQPHLTTLPLGELFAAIGASEQVHAAHKRLRLRLRPTDVRVHSDRVLLERILRNLVANALRYTERGGVLVAARRRGELVRIEVRDTGVGIAPEHQQTVFEEFVQVQASARGSTLGMGLGLAIVRRSATMLGHRVGLASTPGRGSCFWIEVPCATGQPLPAPDVAPAPTPPSRLAGRRVLLIDDEDTVRDAIRDRLEAWGAQVQAFADIESLRHWLAGDAAGPELVLSDYRLRQGDGLLAIDLVRERYGAVPSVLVTGDSAPRDLARLHAAGVRVLHKPFRTEALLDVLAT
jgi:signal transduction histidine kinase/CheY-like chemotaxis protein